MNTNEVLKLALVRLQARTDTADLDAIGALNEALAARTAVPDALTPADKESPEYTEGWNECRGLMLSWRSK